VDRLHKQAECTLELLDDGLAESGEVDVGMSIVEEFGEFGNAFCVCVGLELEALAFQQSFKFFVVGNDTVVDDGELPVGVRSATVSPSCSCISPPVVPHLCGWQFFLEGWPWVAQRVCAIPQ
jgi:hypothetical protein